MRKYTDYAQYYEVQFSRTSYADNVRRQQAIGRGTAIDIQAFHPDNDASIVTTLAEGALFTTGVELANYLGIIPPSAPDTPSSLVAIPGDSLLQISFSGSSNATNFLYSINGNVFIPFNPPQSYSPVAIHGLTNGVSYTVLLKGINDIGSSLASSPVTATPLGFPHPPQSLSVSLANSALYVYFVDGSNGGTPITNYEVSINGVTFSPFSPTTTSSPLYIGGFTNGTTYTLYLRAINALGSSLTSANITATPAIPPAVPTSLALTSGNTSISISFTPGYDGGATITNYLYSSNGSAYTPFSPVQTTSPVFFSNLVNGVSYTISIKAVNYLGSSIASSTVTGIPARYPDPPTSLVTTPSNTSISISFVAGANNGTAIINYQYSLDGSNFSLFSPAVTTSPVRISGLSNGTLYTVYLKAMNSVGTSYSSSPVSATPATFPSPPTALVGTPSNASIFVSFSNGDTGGSPITNYQYSTDGSNFTLFSPAQTTSPVLLTGLSNGTLYTVYLKAVNAVGSSIASTSTSANPVTFPSPPTSLVATPSNTSIRISFSTGDTGGRSITNYQYSLDGSNFTLFSPAQTTSPVLLTGLSNGTLYTVYLEAVTSFATSIASGSVSAIPARVPDAPTSLVADIQDTSLLISFISGSNGGSPITNYQYSTDGSNYTPFSPALTTSPVQITGLTNGITYTIYLAGINSMGAGASASVTQTPRPPVVPDPPTQLAVIPGDSSLTIPFIVGFNGRSPITNYSYSIDGSIFTEFSPAQATPPVTVGGLSNGTVYTVYLKAINVVGSSIASDTIIASPIPGSFSPTSITGASLWLDSLATPSVLVSSNTVTGWNDSSGTGNNFTASGGIIRYGGSAQINKRPAINFTTALPTVTRLSRTFQISSSAAVISLFMVIQQTGISLAGSNSFIFTNNIASVNSISVLTLASTSNLNVNVQGSLRDTTTNIINSPVLVSVIIGRSPNAIYINGTIPSVSASNFGSGSLLLNNSATWSISGSSFLGYIGEIISYPTALSIDNQQKVESYLGWKWGIQSNLNSSSIWKYTPPTGDTVPGAPTVIYVLAGISNAYVFFTPGSGTVVGYQYTVNNGTSYTILNPPQTTSPLYISTVLTNTLYVRTYSFLRAFNGGGFSSTATAGNNFYNSNLTFQTPVYLIDPTNATCYSGSGTSITNIGSAGGSGTLTGSISYGIGSNLSRNVFNFTGGFMNIVPASTSSGNFAISAWIYPSTTTDSKNNFIIGGSAYSFGWSNSSLIFQTYLSGFATPIPYYSSSMSNILVANTWQHISAMFLTNGGGAGGSTNNLVLFFLNGVQVTTTDNIIVPLNTTVVFASSRFYVGSALSNITVPSSMSNIMNGQLGSLKVWTNTSGGGYSTLSYFVNEFNATRANFGV
jgi:hypothetical protein